MSMIGIKFVEGGKIYNANTDTEYNIGDKVVVESVRGLEIAEVTKPVGSLDGEIVGIVRKATDSDLKKCEELKNQESKVINLTNELIKKYNLDMKLVDASFTLDGTKVIINYVCEDRVDFRELVKDLAGQLKLRIELRQIGIRDQAKKIGGIGFCGKECCCKKYLNDFDKVSIKMAKTQGLSLNPTKISGICGRLMCCLAYENDFYSEVAGIMPKLNSKVKTPDGIGTVIYNNLLKQVVTVRVENENDTKVNEYTIDQLVILPKENTQNANPKSQKKEEKEVKKGDANSNKLDKTNKDNTKEKEEKPFNKNKKHKKNKNYEKHTQKQ